MASNLVYNDVITTSVMPDTIRTIYSRELEFTARGLYIFDQFAEPKREHAAEKGTLAVWNVVRNLAPTIGALQENVDVDTQQLQSFQVNLSIQEYGNAIGTTEKLNKVSYWGPISNLVTKQLAPQMAMTLDRVARNAAWAGAPKRFVGGAANRAGLSAGDVATIDTIKQAAHHLGVYARIDPTEGGYVAVVHPSVIYDIREDPLWEDVGRYSDPNRFLNGEVGKIFGVRFVLSNDARLPNAGTSDFTATLTGSHAFNSNILTMSSTTGLAAGDEISLFAASQSTPDGTGTTEESVIVKSVDDGTHVTLEYATSIAHANADKVRRGLDIFPMMFLGSTPPYGKAVVTPPDVRVPPMLDKLQRMSYIGWYTMLGYGTLRNWTYLVVESAASQDAKYVFGF